MGTKTAAELATEYGFAEAFFRAEPELWTLFNKARSGKWSITKFQGEFMKTKWYRDREASVRQWADLTTRDPSEATNKINERVADMSDQFSQLGLQVPEATIRDLATQSLQYSWSKAQMTDVIASFVSYAPGDSGGGVAAVETRIKDLAYQFGVSVNNDQMQDWIQGIISEKYTDDNVTDFLRDAARSKYAGLVPQLDAGRTTRDIAGQHLTEFSRLLEIDPGNVSLDDPVLAKALQGTIDPKTGLPQAQTVFQMSQDVKKDKRWLSTKNARDSMVDSTFGVLRDMGLV